MSSTPELSNLKRNQQAIALCTVAIFFMMWKIWDKVEGLVAQNDRLAESISNIESEVVKARSRTARERKRARRFEVRNALFAVVPCDREPGGLCPVNSDLQRRAQMVHSMIHDLGVRDLSGINLQATDLSGMELGGLDLHNARLDYADLSGAKLRRADLRHASLIGADLSNADLSGALLTYADLTGAGLEGTILEEAQLHATRIDGAHACRARFTNAKLGSTSFENAALWGADFTGTPISGNFRGAHAGDDTQWTAGAPNNRGLVVAPYTDIHTDIGPLSPVWPAYGPEVAPFIEGASTEPGTVCQRYLQEVVAKSL